MPKTNLDSIKRRDQWYGEPLREALQEAGISAEDYERAKEKAQADRITIQHALEAMAVVPIDTLLQAFARLHKVQIVRLQELNIPRSVTEMIPKEIAQRYRIIPVERAGNTVVAATADPKNLKAFDEVRFKTGFLVKPVLASEIAITGAIERYYSKQIDVEKIAGGDGTMAGISRKKFDDARVIIGANSSDPNDGPIIKVVNFILMQCLEKKASDIHFEPYETYLRVRLRIDGALHEIARPPQGMKDPLISRIKIMARLNIAEKRMPQDGQISVQLGNKQSKGCRSRANITVSTSTEIRDAQWIIGYARELLKRLHVTTRGTTLYAAKCQRRNEDHAHPPPHATNYQVDY